MKDVIFTSLLVGLSVASSLNVIALLFMRYKWQWERYTPESVVIHKPEDMESPQKIYIETGVGTIETDTTHLCDLLPFNGTSVWDPDSTETYYVRGNLVLMDLGVAWPIAKFASISAATAVGLWALAPRDPLIAALIIGTMLAIPAWGLLVAISLMTRRQKMSVFTDILGRVRAAHNNSLKVDAGDGPAHNPDNNRRAP